MAGFQDWLKKNTIDNYGGKLGAGFIGLDVANIVASDNKLKALLKTVANMVLMRPMIAVGLAGAFAAVSKSVRALVHDTGSLEVYLKKLAQVQGLQRVFSPLVGGAEAAKRKVAELLNFSARFGQNFGAVGEAGRSLEIYTRGAYSSAQALKTVGDAAAATGNGLVQTSEAVGEFYARLRAGEPIAGAAEKLKEMGVINDATAQTLVSLQESGAGVSRVFEELTGALNEHAGGMDSLKGDVASVAEAYESAKTTLGEKFASPFADDDIENTKNMTAAMQAIAPTVSDLAQWLATLTGGFSTVKSWIAKTAAETPGLRLGVELVVKVLTGLIAVVSVVSGIGLGAWLIGAAGMALTAAAALVTFTGATGAAATAIMALGVAVRVAAIATGIGAIVVALATAAGVIYNFVGAADKQKTAVDDLRRAHQEADNAMKRQIANITTLQERHEALTKALQEQAAAQAELNAAISDGKSPAEIRALQERLNSTRANVRSALEKPREGLGPSPEEQRRIDMEVSRSRNLNEQAFQNEMSEATPERRAELMRARIEDLRSRGGAAQQGVDASATVAGERADAGMRVATLKARVDALKQQGAGAGDGPLMAAQRALAEARSAETNAGLKAPQDSSVFAETMAQKLEAARQLEAGVSDHDERRRLKAVAGNATETLGAGEGLPSAIANWRRYAEQRRQEEGNVGQMSVDRSAAEADLARMEREQRLTDAREETEREIAELKTHGVDRAEQEYELRRKLLDAELEAERAKTLPDQARIDELEGRQAALDRERSEGRRREFIERQSVERELAGGEARQKGTQAGDAESVDLANLDAFAKRFEQLRDLFGDSDGGRKALDLTQQAIFDRNSGAVASSLAKIGGGGGVYSDPAMDIQREIKALTERSTEYLASIDAKTATASGPENVPEAGRPGWDD